MAEEYKFLKMLGIVKFTKLLTPTVLQNIGYKGCFSTTTTVYKILNPCTILRGVLPVPLFNWGCPGTHKEKKSTSLQWPEVIENVLVYIYAVPHALPDFYRLNPSCSVLIYSHQWFYRLFLEKGRWRSTGEVGRSRVRLCICLSQRPGNPGRDLSRRLHSRADQSAATILHSQSRLRRSM